MKILRLFRCTKDIITLLLIIIIAGLDVDCRQKTPQKYQAEGWVLVPEIIAQIVLPQFPARDFIVTDFGAIGDSTTECYTAFSDAIRKCNAQGGGKIIVAMLLKASFI